LERFGFGRDSAFTPREEFLEDVMVAPLTAPLSPGGSVQAAVFHVAPGGRIGRQPSTVPQVLAVLEDQVRSAEHETRTDVGLTALVLEGNGVAPYRMP
jgi:hypothetical protein